MPDSVRESLGKNGKFTIKKALPIEESTEE
jgi:hypothetical protein